MESGPKGTPRQKFAKQAEGNSRALPGFPTKNGMTSIAKMTYLPGFAKTQTGAAYGGSHPDEDFGA